jgi:hypothetical protein
MDRTGDAWFGIERTLGVNGVTSIAKFETKLIPTMKLSTEEFLVYRRGRRRQQTIKRYFIQWRKEQEPPIPMRCDNEACYFYQNPLQWNGKPLNLILDHKNGVSGDDRHFNLQFLCPNCNSQQSTHGGGNKGKVEQHDGGFALNLKNGKRNHVLPVETAKSTIISGNVQLVNVKAPAQNSSKINQKNEEEPPNPT